MVSAFFLREQFQWLLLKIVTFQDGYSLIIFGESWIRINIIYSSQFANLYGPMAKASNCQHRRLLKCGSNPGKSLNLMRSRFFTNRGRAKP